MTVDPQSRREVRTATSETRIQPGPAPQQSPATATPSVPLDPSITDPSAARLHDISGQILMYYAVNKRLPDRLDELAAFADLGTEPSYVSPTSGKPYAYLPAGLVTPGQPRRLIVYEAALAAGAKRWGILMGEPQGDQPAAMWVVPLPDEVFKAYVPSADLAPVAPAVGGAIVR